MFPLGEKFVRLKSLSAHCDADCVIIIRVRKKYISRIPILYVDPLPIWTLSIFTHFNPISYLENNYHISGYFAKPKM